MSLFGYERRPNDPGPTPKFIDGDLLFVLGAGVMYGFDGMTPSKLYEEHRGVMSRMGLGKAMEPRDFSDAQPKVLELWAFETGRMP